MINIIPGCDFVFIEPGKFIMGGPHKKMAPLCDVELTCGFYLAATPVTNAQWRSLCPEMGNVVVDKPDAVPVVGVDYLCVNEFLERISSRFQRRVDLPTEAEWEYAYRGGTRTEWFWGDAYDRETWGRYAVFEEKTIAPVRTKAPNPYGLYDMAGLVWEWVRGGYQQSASDPYPMRGTYKKSAKNPLPQMGNARMIRGGSFLGTLGSGTAYTKALREETYSYEDVGFRLAVYP